MDYNHLKTRLEGLVGSPLIPLVNLEGQALENSLIGALSDYWTAFPHTKRVQVSGASTGVDLLLQGVVDSHLTTPYLLGIMSVESNDAHNSRTPGLSRLTASLLGSQTSTPYSDRGTPGYNTASRFVEETYMDEYSGPPRVIYNSVNNTVDVIRASGTSQTTFTIGIGFLMNTTVDQKGVSVYTDATRDFNVGLIPNNHSRYIEMMWAIRLLQTLMVGHSLAQLDTAVSIDIGALSDLKSLYEEELKEMFESRKNILSWG